MNNRIKDDRRWDEWRVDFLCEEIYYTMTGLTTEEVDICQEALEQSEKGQAKMTNNFWDEDGWFLFTRDYLITHIDSDDSVPEAVRKAVDLFEKPYHWESEYRDWQYQRLHGETE